MPGLPTVTVTFLFTDIEGSTRLLQQLKDVYADVLAECRRFVRTAVQERGGQEVNTEGDAVFAVFPSAREALLATITAQQRILRHPWPDGAAVRVRMGLHSGEAHVAEGGYVGMDVHRAARICSAGHGGQVLLSDTTHALVAKDLPAGVSLRDLGEHRLKDLAHPHRLFQIVATDLPADFPPLKSLDVLPNNLPVQLTSFIGREREKAEVRRLLSTSRLVTLTGSGGAGKTRLALQVAAEALEEFPDGVWLVELAALSDSSLVPKAVASALGVPEQPGRALTETLVDALRGKSVLVILDNCEHLVAACADLTTALLRACPNLRVLATSREALGVTGETTRRVPSLSVPDPQRLPPLDRFTEYEAVRLFIDRAVASTTQFTLTSSNAPAVAQVCHRLDGIPLAIELAAARVKVLAVEQIAARLDDRFRLLTGGSRTALPRQQTLRATMDWSYDLLAPKERAVLRRLSVFAGGCTLEAVEAMCAGKRIKGHEILDLLTQLVDKSLVVVETHHGEARYRLLETVRQYGQERLSESGERGATQRRHRDWYLEWAEHARPKLRTSEQDVWLGRLRVEHDNLRAALEWSMEEGDTEPGLRLAGRLAWFWYTDGHWSEGRKWLERALALGGDVRSDAQAYALLGATYLARSQGDYDRARAFAEKGMAIARETNNRVTIATFLFNLGVVALQHEGNYSRAKALCEESAVLGRELGLKELLAWDLAQLGHIARDSADYERATTFYAESLAFAREDGEKYVIAYALRNMGVLALHTCDYKRAAALFAESLDVYRAPSWVTEECIIGIAEIACAERWYERAACLFGAGDALHEALGVRRSPRAQVRYDECVAATRAGLEDAAFAEQWAEGRAMTLEQAIEYALEEVGV